MAGGRATRFPLRMTRTAWLAVLGAVALALAIGLAGAWWIAPATVRIDPADGRAVARGAHVYAVHCAACHGANLEGQPDWQSRNAQGRLPAPPHDEHGHTWHHDDQVLFEVTKFGLAKHAPPGYQSDMPAFEGRLSDADIVAALTFIKSRWPPLIHDKRRAAGMD
jgi:mono/diheme cytochrome c family protein